MIRNSSLVVAVSLDGIIGINNKLPWYCPKEMSLMKSIVTKQVKLCPSNQLKTKSITQQQHQIKPLSSLIMGRNTFQSMDTNKSTLYGCEMIVVSSNERFKTTCPKNLIVTSSIDDAILKCNPDHDIFYFGGSRIYQECLDRALCSTLYISRMKYYVKPREQLRPTSNIAFFPKIDNNIYDVVAQPIDNNQFSLQIYNWSIEYCQALIHENSVLHKNNI